MDAGQLGRQLSWLNAWFVASFALALNSSFALVSLRTGNYNVKFQDVSYPGGYNFEINRVYNSKSSFNGSFGWGWGNELDIYLTLEGDGSITVHEYGGGMDLTFYPEGWGQTNLQKSIDLIAEAAKKSGQVSSPKAVEEYKQKLLKDPAFRGSEYGKFVTSKKLTPVAVKPGMKYRAEKAPFQLMKSTPTGYERVSDTGTLEKFDRNGKLVSVQLPNKHFISLSYKNGRIEKLTDSLSRKLFFTVNRDGLIERIEGEGKKVASYKYNDRKELIEAKGFDGIKYNYDYSKDGFYLLQKINFDKPKPGVIEIAYHPSGDFKQWVKSVKDSDGTFTSYDYSRPRGADSIKIGVGVQLANQKSMVFKSSYDYSLKMRPNGEEVIAKLVEDRQGVSTTKIYDEKTGYPIEIQRDKRVAKFSYDSIGRVLKKVVIDKTEQKQIEKSISVSYDATTGKIAEVVEDPDDSGKKSVSQYKYDGAGNLISGKRGGESMSLVYDKLNRPLTMVLNGGKRLNFTYDDASRPITVSQPNNGTLKLAYDQSGNLIPPVPSNPGQSQIAQDLDLANETLRHVIAPANIDFSSID